MPDTHAPHPLARRPLAELEDRDAFRRRHDGPGEKDEADMLAALGFASRAALVDAIVPASIRRRARRRSPR
jgi:glycine dehydrogenase